MYKQKRPEVADFCYLSIFPTMRKKKRAKMALLESNFENRLSFVEESRFFLLHNHVWGEKLVYWGLFEEYFD